MVTKWLHIDFRSRDEWVLPIWTAHNECMRRGGCGNLPQETRELGIYVSTRLSMLPTVYRRVQAEAANVYATVAGREPRHEWSADQEGYVYPIPDPLLYELLLDLDSLLFELNSCCELMAKLFTQVYENLGESLQSIQVGPKIKDLLVAAGHDTQWFADLDTHRNFFAHEATPFLAVDLTNESANGLDLLVMKKNLRRFDARQDYYRLSELAEIVSGFESSKWPIRDHLIEMYRTR